MDALLASALFWQQTLTQQPDQVFRHDTLKPISLEISPEDLQKKNLYRYHRMLESAIQDQQAPTHLTKKLPPPSPVKKREPVRTLIIAPHPDDEILCCAQTLRDRIEEGETIKILYLTDGDAYSHKYHDRSLAYGKTRKEEAREAARRLGLNDEDLFFLGYPDGHLSQLPDKGRLRSLYTGLSQTDIDSLYPRSPYNKTLLKRHLSKILRDFAPTEVFIPSDIKDQHPDHKTASLLIQSVLRTLDIPKPTLHAYIVHNPHHWKTAENNPLNFWKLQLIRVFQSQFHDEYHRSFLERFAGVPEVFETITPDNNIVRKESDDF